MLESSTNSKTIMHICWLNFICYQTKETQKEIIMNDPERKGKLRLKSKADSYTTGDTKCIRCLN